MVLLTQTSLLIKIQVCDTVVINAQLQKINMGDVVVPAATGRHSMSVSKHQLIMLVFAVCRLPTLTEGFLSLGPVASRSECFHHGTRPLQLARSHNVKAAADICASENEVSLDRRSLLSSAALLPWAVLLPPQNANALQVAAPSSTKKCTDIDSCRELGEKKDQADLRANPVTRLPSGVRYKVLNQGRMGSTAAAVHDGSSIDLIYSVSRAGGQYLYSRGFGFETIDAVGNGQLTRDANGLDSLRIVVGQHQVPVGIEQVLVGMKQGERRRVELPPSVGLETSHWEPAPVTTEGQLGMRAYRRILEGFGSQPAFPALLVWDIEVTKIRN